MSRKNRKYYNSIRNVEIKKESDHKIFNAINYPEIFPSATYNISPLSSQGELINNNNYSLITLNRTMLTYAYNTHGLIQVLIDQPVEDAFKGGIRIKTDELDTEELEILEEYLKKNKLITKYKTAKKWVRLFGGAGIILNTDQDPQEEFDIDYIDKNTPFDLIPADRWELNYTYEVASEAECPFNYYGQPIHKSRVLKLTGKEPPSIIRKQLQGWGLSELEKVMRNINSYLKNQNVIFELLDEAKIDVFKIHGYNQSLATQAGRNSAKQRAEFASMQKNYQNALSLDTEDDYIQKQLTFGGLSEILDQIRTGIASDLRIPRQILFGESPQGFDTGDSTLSTYYGMVQSEIRNEDTEADLSLIIKIACQKLFDFVPKFKIEWELLEVISPEHEEQRKTGEFNRFISAYDRGLLDEKQLFDNFKENRVMFVTDYQKTPDLPDYVTKQQDPYPKEVDKEKAIKPQEKSGVSL